MDRFFVFVLGIPLAFLILYYRRQIKEYVGDIPWAERVFGVGGTHTFILLLAFLVFMGSLMYSLGTLQSIVQKFIGPFFPTKPGL